MSREEARRRARNAKVYHVMLPDNGFTEPCAVVKVSDVQEALSEGQAPEPRFTRCADIERQDMCANCGQHSSLHADRNGLCEPSAIATAAIVPTQQAPEPVAQEPVSDTDVAWYKRSLLNMDTPWSRGCAAVLNRLWRDHTAGMDAARVKAIEEMVGLCERRRDGWKSYAYEHGANGDWREAKVGNDFVAEVQDIIDACRALATKGAGS